MPPARDAKTWRALEARVGGLVDQVSLHVHLEDGKLVPPDEHAEPYENPY